MKRIILFMMISCFVFIATSQAQKNTLKWMDKARKSVFTVTSYDKDNRTIANGYGFFISESGEAVSGYSLFKGAARAVVTDSEGKEYPVSHIIGADEIYDVIKIKVDVPRKVSALTIISDPIPDRAPAYHLTYSKGKDIRYKAGFIDEIHAIQDNYKYYKITVPLETGWVNTPVLNTTGAVFGLAQEDASGKNDGSFAVSISYINNLKVGSVDIFNSVYQNIGIRKAWSEDVSDATVSLMLQAGQQNAKEYLATLNDFISNFPTIADGYISRATHYVVYREELSANSAEQQKYLDMALTDLNTASRYTDSKGYFYYNYAKVMYSVAIDDPSIHEKGWTVETALENIRKAIQEEDLPVYRQLEGDIYFALSEFEKAYDSYTLVNNSELKTHETIYYAAKAKENIVGANVMEIIELLTQAIEAAGKTNAESAPYYLERVDKYLMLNQYKEAINDYDEYYYLVNGRVNDSFYYYREQAKFMLGDLSGALADIQQAIQLDKVNPDYYAEEASIYTRMQEYDKALVSIEKALKIAPDFGACYRLMGVCLARQQKKTEACEAFSKAKEYEDPFVDRLIAEHCN